MNSLVTILKNSWCVRKPVIWAALVLAAIFAGAGYLRFLNLTHEGIFGADVFQYWIMGKLWAEGNYTFNDGSAGEFFRPTAYALHAIAFRLFGVNDYAIKILHASMDLFNIALVCAIAAGLGRNLWTGVSAAMLYAFLTQAIGYARKELVHIPSTTFVLLSILFYMLFDAVQKRRLVLGCLCLALAGAALSVAAGMHPDLALLGACFIPFIFFSAYSAQARAKSLCKFVLCALVFTLGVFSLYLVSGCIIGFSRLINLMRDTHATPVDMAPLAQTFIFMTRGMALMSSPVMAGLFLATPALMFIMWVRKYKVNMIAGLPLVFWLGYALLFELLLGRTTHGQLIHRLLIPLAPLVAIGVAYWYTQAIQMLTGRRWIANLVVLLGCVVLAWFNFGPYRGSLALQQAHYQSQFRAVHDVLKDKIGDRKLLVTPYLEYSHRRGFQQDMYFGNQALYIIDFQDLARSLEDIVREYNIKYIFVGKSEIDTRILNQKTFHKYNLNDHYQHESVPLVLGACYGMNSATYSLEREQQLLDQFISAHHGRILWQGRGGILYEIDPNAAPETK